MDIHWNSYPISVPLISNANRRKKKEKRGLPLYQDFLFPSAEFCNFYDSAGSVLDSQHYIHPCC
jgi:hypothetical protein